MKSLLILALLFVTVTASAFETVPDSTRFRIGGYGEVLARFMNYGINRYSGTSYGNERMRRNEISIPRFVIAMDYSFTPRICLGSEIEFESGGVGTAVELENTENGEYETEIEKGGEVAIEQFHVTFKVHKTFNARVGHVVLPIGLTNSNHEPINFFGASRPEGETTIIPSTWHETGLELFGSLGPVDYDLFVVGGLNANGFERETWVAEGCQGMFEVDNFTSPGYALRLDYNIIEGLKIGGSYYFCNDAGRNSDKPAFYSSIGKVRINIITADFVYKNPFLTARANLLYGHLNNASALSTLNRRQSNNSPYSRLVPIAKVAVSYGGELGLNLKNICFAGDKFPVIYPFARYEFYNPQHKGDVGQTMDLRYKVSMWTLGANYFILPNLVAKVDYSTRKIGGGKYNNENEVSIGLAYTGWFFQHKMKSKSN